jgi:N6-L-threonylcarbamoyladenine synthase
VANHPVQIPGQEANDLCASFQRAVCDVLVAKTRMALEQIGAQRLVVAGGVACNSGLRSAMAALAAERGTELHIPRPALCGDNAAMLAVPGNYYLENGLTSALDLDVTATWDMDRIKGALP